MIICIPVKYYNFTPENPFKCFYVIKAMGVWSFRPAFCWISWAKFSAWISLKSRWRRWARLSAKHKLFSRLCTTYKKCLFFLTILLLSFCLSILLPLPEGGLTIWAVSSSDPSHITDQFGITVLKNKFSNSVKSWLSRKMTEMLFCDWCPLSFNCTTSPGRACQKILFFISVPIMPW